VPKRLRRYLEREPRAVSAVLHILLRVIEAHLRQASGASSHGSQARFGAVSFIHRFGASLNRRVHYDENHPGSRASRALAGAQIRSRRIGHCCVIDGVFEPAEDAGDIPQSVRFRPASALTPAAVVAIAEQVRVRVLRWFARSGLIERDDIREMLAWKNSGFSLDAAVLVAAHDRAGLERLLRYCARPPFALERLELLDAERVVYRLPKLQRGGTTALSLTPLELIDHLAAPIPPPRRHGHRYHGMLAPNSPLRAAAVVLGRDLTDDPSASAEVPAPSPASAPNARSPARYRWVMLLARVFESLPLVCPNCGADMRIIAFVTEAVPVQRILADISEPTEPPPIATAREPPAWDDAPEPALDRDLLQQPESDFEFDQRIAW